MTKLLLIRHGQSQANLHGAFAGHWDTPATDLGLHQAAITGKYVAQNYKVDAVYSSDLQRARAVGEAVAENTGLDMTTDRQLREINAGQWEKVSFDTLDQSFPSYRLWRTDIGSSYCDGGETVAQLQERFVGAVKRIAMNHPNQTVVIATHATPIRTLQCHCVGKGLGEMQNIPWVTNASITEVFYEDGCFTLGKVAQDDHLGDLVSSLPANV